MLVQPVSKSDPRKLRLYVPLVKIIRILKGVQDGPGFTIDFMALTLSSYLYGGHIQTLSLTQLWGTTSTSFVVSKITI